MNRQQRRKANKKKAKRPHSGPQIAEAENLYTHGRNLQSQGQHEQAFQIYKQIAARYPMAKAWNTMAIMLEQAGQMDQAVTCFDKAREIEPSNDRYHCNLGTALYKLRRYDEALSALNKALECDPKNETYLIRISVTLQFINLTAFNSDFKETILRCLKSNQIEHKNLQRIWLSLIKLDPQNEVFFGLITCQSYEDFKKNIDIKTLKKTLNDPFLLLGLENLMVYDFEFEKLLNHFRRFFLENPDLRKIHLEFLCALGCYNFFSEYIANEDEEERKAISDLQTEINAENIAMLSCYRPLHQLKNTNEISPGKVKGHFYKNLLRLQISEPLKEQKLKTKIKAATKVSDDVSQQVRAQYEENPYPRWKNITHSQQPEITKELQLDYLIAGCGTGFATSETAQMLPKAKITAVDLSLSSLAYAKRKAGELGLHHITFMQGDILNLEALDQKFDVIECSGVLHHMKDPLAGWRVLTKLLKPGGRMNICLYSEEARQNVVAARAIIAEKNYGSSLEDIRRLRTDIAALPEGHDAKTLLEHSDFYFASNCRDFLFHIQETRYTPARIQEEINALDMEFLGFKIDDPEIIDSYRKKFPEDAAMTNLENWTEFEKQHPEIFTGMYEFWCGKKDGTVNEKAEIFYRFRKQI